MSKRAVDLNKPEKEEQSKALRQKKGQHHQWLLGNNGKRLILDTHTISSSADQYLFVHSNTSLKCTKLDSLLLINANFTNADLRGAWLYRCRFDNQTSVQDCVLYRTRGLWGDNKSSFNNIYGSDRAKFGHTWDWPRWSRLRGISTFRLVAASYIVVGLIILYTVVARWYNRQAIGLREWSEETQQAADTVTLQQLGAIAGQLGQLPAPSHFGWQLVLAMSMVVGTTLYAALCPEHIKEYSQSHWEYQMGRPLIEYRSADYAYFEARWICAIFFFVGLIGSIIYLFMRGFDAFMFLLGQ